MKFKQYLTEKKAELTGDEWKDKFIKQLNQWDTDISRMTKLYKSLKPTIDDLKNFQKANKAFIIFHNNLEKWVYEDLLNKKVFGKKDEDPFTRDVRSKAWDTLHHLSPNTLFPSAWNYKNDKHEDAPQELDYHDGGRKNKILRYQRSWRKTKEAIIDLITYKSDILRERKPDEQIQVSGVNILIKNKDEAWAELYLKRFLKILPKIINQIKKQGMSKAIKDFKIQINFRPETVDGIPSGLTSGAYDHIKDILYIFPLGLTDSISDSTLIHEIGHRYWFKHIPPKAKKAWSDKIEKNMITIKKEHIEKFMQLYFRKETESIWREKDIIKHANKNITDPTLLAVFIYLAKHHPLFDTGNEDTKETYMKWMYDHSKGEQIPLEWISDYGRENPKEAFADAFKIWVGGNKGKLGIWTRAFFKEIISTGGANIKENIILKYIL
jgi:hypothetical protein